MMLGNSAKRDLHNLYSTPNIVWIIESRRMKWAKQVACMGKISWKTRRMADPDMNGRMLLNLILHMWLNLAQDRDHWQCLIYTAMKRWVS